MTLTRASVRALPALAALAAALAAASPAGASNGDEDRIAVAGNCGAGATSSLEVRARDGRLEIRFRVRSGRKGARWRAALVHERRVAWSGAVRAGSGGIDVRRLLPDLSGADTVAARAWGPRGLTCRASATLPE
jgi:hypothetical protein